GVVASTRDLTELELLAEQLRQAQKMEAVGQLAAGVAHHFNNMLTVIMGYVSLALRELPPYHPIAENLERVQVISQRAAAIVWQILAFARKQLIRPEMVNLNELVLNAETKLKQLIPAAIELHTRLAPDLGLVKVDVYQFGHLLSHLVANARDAMPQGGWLTLATANISVPPGQSAEVPPGSYVLLTVSDTGVGMTEEVKAHLFEPFFTTKEVGQGTGLGLATCFGIVKQHGGYITLDSQPGQGATFKIYLPRVP
ncbi:MAG: hybrid sensor histidine kinase/response regulator, partial [Chloroflexi bacterium]|nr:hybrid sensor histidine kinase/response regulator [Chloroflexota bacterium]